MQVSKRKISSSQNEPVFKTIKSQAELKRLIDEYLKAKANERKHKIVEGINEAMEYAKREKIKKKEDEVELEKAKETLEKKAFDIAGYDKQYFDELYQIATKYPRQFNEIIKKSEIDELVKEFEEYKQEKKVEDAVKSTTVDVMEHAIHDVNTKQKLEIGSIIDKELSRLDTISKRMGVPEKVAQIPLLGALIDKIERDNPGITPYNISRFIHDKYGVNHNFELRDDNLNKIRPILRLALSPPGGASATPPAPTSTSTSTGKTKKKKSTKKPGPPAPTVGKGLTGYIGGKIIKDVLKRFNVLVGEASSGNTSPEIKAEILDVIDILLKNKKITKPQHKRIVKAFRLDKP